MMVMKLLQVIFAQEDRDIAASASRVLSKIVSYLKSLKQPQSTKLLYGDISVADEIEKFAEFLDDIANSKTQGVDIPDIIQSLGVFVPDVMQDRSYSISLVCLVFWCLLTISVFRRIRNDVTTFLDHLISHKDEDDSVKGINEEKKWAMKRILSKVLDVGCTLVLILLAITLFLSFWWYMVWMLTSFISVAFGVQWEIWTPWWIHFLYWF